MVDQVALLLYKYFDFPLSVSFHPFTIFIFMYMRLISENLTHGRILVTSKKNAVSEVMEQWLEKYFISFITSSFCRHSF